MKCVCPNKYVSLKQQVHTLSWRHAFAHTHTEDSHKEICCERDTKKDIKTYMHPLKESYMVTDKEEHTEKIFVRGEKEDTNRKENKHRKG